MTPEEQAMPEPRYGDLVVRLAPEGAGGILRLVIRYQGIDRLEADQKAISVDGRTVGTLQLQKIRAERTEGGGGHQSCAVRGARQPSAWMARKSRK